MRIGFDSAGEGKDYAAFCHQRAFACFHRRRWPFLSPAWRHEVKDAHRFIKAYRAEWQSRPAQERLATPRLNGAAFLCAGITPETREDHAAYIASWLKVLKDDKRAIFTAARHAQNAADYLHALQRA